MERVGNTTTVAEVKELDRQGLIVRNLARAPLKDTVTVPDGGYTIVRFHANNPGKISQQYACQKKTGRLHYRYMSLDNRCLSYILHIIIFRIYSMQTLISKKSMTNSKKNKIQSFYKFNMSNIDKALYLMKKKHIT